MFARKKIGFRFIGNSSRINVKQVRIEGLRFPSCELFCVKDVSVIQNFKKKKKIQLPGIRRFSSILKQNKLICLLFENLQVFSVY